ncbi:hypothetical protein LUZ61_009320 [Rhynchospora tenuis]|uniref:Ankyrin n=1 Tax=Rhynchospora tenuis TaxID=198213 RepID=A0AAD5ZX04_9POAL|nr:hypothetical protein LUZ61_009320 [Rhynchospora tenuis]
MVSYPGQSPQNIQEMLTQPISSEDDIRTATQQPLDDPLHRWRLSEELFKVAMKREWETLLDLYQDRRVQNEKITRAKDTVLHVALSSAPVYIVLKLLEKVDANNSPEEKKRILGSRNESGDTPLHLAASLGPVTVCRKITKMCPELVITARNNLQETPLFTAVRHGKKKSFFVLESAVHKLKGLTSYEQCLSRDISHCRRNDGINILHIAIKREHFSLAYEIIKLYPELVNYVNSSGESALHVLARMASVFKSGTRYDIFDKIIYYSTITEPLKLKFKFNFNENKENYLPLNILKDKVEARLPSTCKACFDLYVFIWDVMKATFHTVGSSLTGICKTRYDDEENQSEAGNVDESKSSENQDQRRQIPPNCDVACSFFKIIIKLLLIVLGIGSRRLQTIRKLKQTHKNARKIMKELVDHSTHWEYRDGKEPELTQLPFELMTEPPEVQYDENTDSEGKHRSSTKVNNIYNDIMATTVEEGRDILKKNLKKLSVEESPVLIAAKTGITEMVQRILEKFPVAILDQDEDEKNIVLLAAEHRQVHVYKLMLGLMTMKEHVFAKADNQGNSALHLAAAAIQPPTDTGVALQSLQMQRQIKCTWQIRWCTKAYPELTTMKEGQLQRYSP